MMAEEKGCLCEGAVYDFLERRSPRLPPPPLGQKWKVLVNDVFCVKLGVTGEEALNPTLLGFFPFQPSAGGCVVVGVTSVSSRNI